MNVRVPGLAPCAGDLQNLSTHGALVALASELPLGIEARLVLELPDGEAPLEVSALTVRQTRVDREERTVDVAFCFIHPPTEAVRRLSAMVWHP